MNGVAVVDKDVGGIGEISRSWDQVTAIPCPRVPMRVLLVADVGLRRYVGFN